jgi:hypothetical protein
MSEAKARAREREIERRLPKLRSKDPQERAEAALYLGEAAYADAVPDLIDMYETDDDKRVRNAAKYALGQFRAIDKFLAKGQNTRVEKLLADVEERGILGRRAGNGAALQVVLMLALLLGLLVAANIFSPQLRQQLGRVNEVVQAANAPRRDRPTLLTEVQTYLTTLRDDAQTVTREYQRLLSGDTLTCAAFFNDPAAYLIAPDDASANGDIAGVVTQLNQLRLDVQNARVPYTDTCAGNRTLTTGDSGALLAPLTQINAAFTELNERFATIVDPDRATPVPTPTPLPPADVNVHLAPLNALIDSLTAADGASALLLGYWTEVQATGATAGCAAAVPTIPANYVLPEADAAASPNLATAVTQVNTALDAIRNGWNQLTASCAENAVATQGQAGVTNAQAAAAALTFARDVLALVANGEL